MIELMTKQQVSEKRDELLKRLKVVQLEIKMLQDRTCQHPDLQKIPKSNTGNYDPSSDCYWYECKCPDCGKFWTEDQ